MKGKENFVIDYYGGVKISRGEGVKILYDILTPGSS